MFEMGLKVIFVNWAVILTSSSLAAGGQLKTPTDDTKFKNLTAKFCPNFPKIVDGLITPSVPWEDGPSANERYELISVSYALGFNAETSIWIPPNLAWRQRIIDLFAYIAKTTCNSKLVSKRYINAVRHLFLYYLIKKKSEIGSAHSQIWEEFIVDISKCAAQIPAPINMGYQQITVELPSEIPCRRINTYNTTRVVEGTLSRIKVEEPHNITFIEEHMDSDQESKQNGKLLAQDMVIDSMWWLFSITFARCYYNSYPNEYKMLLLYKRFKEDFLKDLTEKWRHGGIYNDYPQPDKPSELPETLVFNHPHSKVQLHNLRMCASAAYDHEGLLGRYLVRPVKVWTSQGNKEINNEKLKSSIPTTTEATNNEMDEYYEH